MFLHTWIVDYKLSGNSAGLLDQFSRRISKRIWQTVNINGSSIILLLSEGNWRWTRLKEFTRNDSIFIPFLFIADTCRPLERWASICCNTLNLPNVYIFRWEFSKIMAISKLRMDKSLYSRRIPLISSNEVIVKSWFVREFLSMLLANWQLSNGWRTIKFCKLIQWYLHSDARFIKEMIIACNPALTSLYIQLI